MGPSGSRTIVDQRNELFDHGVNENPTVYYGGGYWNELEVVNETLNQRIGGRTLGPWFHDFSERCGKTFKRALILNCGNGWVERDMISAGLIAEAVGIDYSESLLQEARQAAATHGLPLQYRQMDVNSAEFPSEEFDLIVNYSAAHHISMIDRVFRELCRILPEDGCILSFDYIGPHRNQYTLEAWDRARMLNDELPPHVRQSMVYPHLPTMLCKDSTEAIHSELMLKTLHRYFDVERFVPLGGAIAYPLLTGNERLFDLDDKDEQAMWAGEVLRFDQEFLDEHPDSSLFAYFVARPNKTSLEQTDALRQWEEEEFDREDRARTNGGEYYPRTAFQDVYIRLVAENRESERLRRKCSDLQEQLQAIEGDPVFPRLASLRQSRLVRTVRNTTAVRRFERRLRRQHGPA